jgi:hypothetical protein
MTELAGTETPEERERVTRVRVNRWKVLEPPGIARPNLTGYSADRAKVISGLRDLADFLEARPEIPVSQDAIFHLYAFADGTEEQKRAQVDYASTLLDAPVTDRTAHGSHYSTGVCFGNVWYSYVAISKEPEEPSTDVDAVPVVSRRKAGNGSAARGRRR